MLHWRQELDKKYAGIRKYHDFFGTRNSDSNAELRVREDCSTGDLHITERKLRTGSSREMQCFPAPHLVQNVKYLLRKCLTCIHGLSLAIDGLPTRIPVKFLSQNKLSKIERTHRKVAECSVKKSIVRFSAAMELATKRWSEGHTTKAGCLIYHNVTAP